MSTSIEIMEQIDKDFDDAIETLLDSVWAPKRAYIPASKSTDWETPQDLFDTYDELYHFDLDVCASQENTKCPEFFSLEGHFRWTAGELIKLDNGTGLDGLWGNKRCWMNPPYGKGLDKWVARASDAASNGATVVALLPARTDVRWFHQYIYKKKYVQVEFLKGRLKFGNSTNSAPFPSMIVIFH